MKNVLIIGLGRFGRHIAMQLNQLGHEIMAVDWKEERVDKVLPSVTNAQIGDSTNAEFLQSLGIGNYDICFVTIGGSFQNSLETTSLLKELGAKLVISRAERDVHEKFLLRNGADKVVYPEKQVAKWASCEKEQVILILLPPQIHSVKMEHPASGLPSVPRFRPHRSLYRLRSVYTHLSGFLHPHCTSSGTSWGTVHRCVYTPHLLQPGSAHFPVRRKITRFPVQFQVPLSAAASVPHWKGTWYLFSDTAVMSDEDEYQFFSI